MQHVTNVTANLKPDKQMPGASIEGKNMVLCLYISFALVATVALVWNPFRVCGLDYYEYKYL